MFDFERNSRRQEVVLAGENIESGLVEADAGDVGFFDGGRVVGLVFGEGDGEILDSVGSTKFFEEHDEFAEFLDKPVVILG